MTRYRTVKAAWHGDEDCSWEEGKTQGDTVFDDGSWSEDQFTGIYTPDGDMIMRCPRRIGYRWSDD